jgi:hypothetical protein
MSVINVCDIEPLAISESEAARLIGLSRSSVRSLRERGEIESIKLGEKDNKKSRRLYSLASLRKFLDSNTEK